MAPVETVKTKCIEMNKAFLEGLRYIVRTEGIRGIYQGGTATALKQGTNQGFRFMWFNEYKRIVTKDGQVPLSPIGGFLGGMSAGCFSVRYGGFGSRLDTVPPSLMINSHNIAKTVCNNPFDVVKTRLQGTQASKYSGTLDCFKKIISNEGVGAFYAGLVPRLGRVVPGQGIIFMSFESIQSTLEANFAFFRL